MSFLCENSGDFRNPSLDELFDKALASVRRMAEDYAAQQNKALIVDIATAIADRDRLVSQLRELRALLADCRPAIVARAATSPAGLDPSLLPRIDEALAT